MNKPKRQPERKEQGKPEAAPKPMGIESGLALHLDARSEIPIYVQLKNQLRYMIQSKQLEPGAQLPTMRQLGVDLGIDANTVARVYRELELEGLIVRHQGRGTFISHDVPAPTRDTRFQDAQAALEGVVRMMKGFSLSEQEIIKLLREFTGRLERG
jgi:GntR family transcriptional regulator